MTKAKDEDSQKNGDTAAAPHSRSEPLTRLQVAEVLVAAAAAVGAVIYVLLQGLYVEFYDDFGVRPEEAGMDRIAVLSRAAWVAFASLLGFSFFVLLRTALGRSRWSSRRVKIILGALSVLLIFATIWAYRELVLATERLSEKVTYGRSVSGLSLPVPLLHASIPILDVRAHPAEVTWLEPKNESQTGNEGEGYIPKKGTSVMYIGRNEKMAMFYTRECATVILPVDNLRITLLDQGRKLEPDDNQLGWDPKENCPGQNGR